MEDRFRRRWIISAEGREIRAPCNIGHGAMRLQPTNERTGTYVDMCSKLPLVDPSKIVVPTMVMRGQYDGIAAFDDLLEFLRRLPNPDKHLAVMPGVAHASLREKNFKLVYHLLHSFFTQPEPVYRE